MKFTTFFKTTVGMKPQSEAGSGGGGDHPHKVKYTIKDEKHPSAKDKKQAVTLVGHGS